jgi:Pathogenicity locus
VNSATSNAPADLRQLGITSPGELPGRDPYAMYDDLCRITGQRHDPCLLDVFIAAVRFMEGAPPLTVLPLSRSCSRAELHPVSENNKWRATPPT